MLATIVLSLMLVSNKPIKPCVRGRVKLRKNTKGRGPLRVYKENLEMRNYDGSVSETWRHLTYLCLIEPTKFRERVHGNFYV